MSSSSSPRERVSFPRAMEIGTRVRVPKPQKKNGRKGSRRSAELLLRLQLESNPDALCLVRAALQCATEAMHFPESDCRAIVRSVDEALANVIRHAYQGRGGLPIEVTCRRLWKGDAARTPCALEIILMDSGIAADPKNLRGRPLEEVRPGGLGLHFIKQSMDVVEFSRRKGKNLLRMVKLLALSKPEEEPQGE